MEMLKQIIDSNSLTGDIDAMLKGSITESLIGIIPDSGLTLDDYRSERLSKHERAD